MDGIAVVALVLLASVAFGLWRKATEGRVRAVSAKSTETSPFASFGTTGERATIVQFSAAVCAPCRAAKTIAAEVVRTVPGVTQIGRAHV